MGWTVACPIHWKQLTPHWRAALGYIHAKRAKIGHCAEDIWINCKPVVQYLNTLVPARFVTEMEFPERITSPQRQLIMAEAAQCEVKHLIHDGANIEFVTAESQANRVGEDKMNINILGPAILAAIITSFSPLMAIPAPLNDVDAVPHLDSVGQSGYRDFLSFDKHRAFAISPGGTWAWKGGEPTAESAERNAMQACQHEGGLSCALYALDDKVVFDVQSWARLWGPYLNSVEASQAQIGLNRGQRFHNLTFKSADGKAHDTRRFSRQGGYAAFLGLLVPRPAAGKCLNCSICIKLWGPVRCPDGFVAGAGRFQQVSTMGSATAIESARVRFRCKE